MWLFVATAGREKVSFVIGVYFDVFLLVWSICIKVIIGFASGTYDHFKVINLFLFYKSANDFVNRRFVVVVTLHYFTLPIRNSSLLFSIYNLCPRPSSALTHFRLVLYLD